MKRLSSFVPLVLVMMNLATAFADGGVIGSGGDGRSRRAAPSAVADVTLPVPPGMVETTLVVTGRDGFLGMRGVYFSQPYFEGDFYAFRKCSRRNGLVELASCDRWTLANLNQAYAVTPGFYQITYTNSLMDLEIRRGERRSIALQGIHLPASSFGVRIFRDLSDASEQSKALNEMLGTSQFNNDARYALYESQQRLAPDDIVTGSYMACYRVEAGSGTCASTTDAAAFVRTLLGSGDLGANSGDRSNWAYGRRYYVMSNWVTQAGTPVVWVLPGTYGALFRAAPGGEESLTLGIRVEE